MSIGVRNDFEKQTCTLIHRNRVANWRTESPKTRNLAFSKLIVNSVIFLPFFKHYLKFFSPAKYNLFHIISEILVLNI